MPSQAAERNKKRRMEKKSRNLNAAGKETTTTTTSVSVGGGVSSSSGEKEETEDIEFVERTGAYGSYGANNDRFSIEDDEWATSQRAWNALAKHLEKFKGKKIWAPFYYDGKVKTRLKQAGFRGKVTHEKRDFFKLMNDSKFLANVDAIIDNPPYTGKGMKEKILTKLIAKDVPFCLLFPLGVLHSKFLRDLTAAKARRKDEKKNKQQGKKEKEKERIKARGISLRRSKEVLCREIDVFHFHTQYVYILEENSIV